MWNFEKAITSVRFGNLWALNVNEPLRRCSDVIRILFALPMYVLCPKGINKVVFTTKAVFRSLKVLFNIYNFIFNIYKCTVKYNRYSLRSSSKSQFLNSLPRYFKKTLQNNEYLMFMQSIAPESWKNCKNSVWIYPIIITNLDLVILPIMNIIFS